MLQVKHLYATVGEPNDSTATPTVVSLEASQSKKILSVQVYDLDCPPDTPITSVLEDIEKNRPQWPADVTVIVLGQRISAKESRQLNHLGGTFVRKSSDLKNHDDLSRYMAHHLRSDLSPLFSHRRVLNSKTRIQQKKAMEQELADSDVMSDEKFARYLDARQTKSD